MTRGPAARRATLWARLEPVLDELLDLPVEERAARAERLCGTDGELLANVRDLLADLGPSESFLAGSVGELLPDLLMDLETVDGSAGEAAPEPVADRAGEELGVYRIEGFLGRGGMGDVYLGRRVDGAFERRVAIKIARTRARGGGRDGRGRSSASHEQHILAAMDHPNIARLFDAGLTADGLPYVAMEYVEGDPIDVCCERRGLSIDGRLLLFLEVCQAVDHAHRRLVIHRDLKPSNILVGQEGVKLLDFGIAKLLDSAGSGVVSGAVPGAEAGADGGTLHLTPEYAAPEQFLRGPLTVATDVYALGAILFELLTKSRLRDDREVSPSIWMGQVLQQQPARASSRLAHLDRRWAKELRGDLDAIVARALDPDPEIRYDSVRALAEDVRRYRGSLPVLARSGNRAYRAARFLRRHWFAFAAAALVVLSIVVGGTAAFVQSRVAQEERRQALVEAAKAERVSRFLVELFDAWDPYRFRHGEVSARDLLDLGRRRAEEGLGGDFEVRSELLLTLAEVYLRLGLIEAADETLTSLTPDAEASVELGRLPELHARAQHLRGQLLAARGKLQEALEHYDQALGLIGAGGPELEDEAALTSARSRPTRAAIGQILLSKAHGLQDLGRHGEAEVQLRRSLTLSRAHGWPEMEAGALASLASVIHRGQRHDADLLRQAIELYRSPGVDDPANLRTALNNLGIHELDSGRWSLAASSWEESLALGRVLLGPEHPQLAADLTNLARLRIDQGKFDLALDLLDEAEAIYRSAGIDGATKKLALSMNRGRALAELGRSESWEVLDSARQRFIGRVGSEHPWLPSIDMRMAEAALRLERPQRALVLVRRSLEGLAPDHVRRADAELVRGAALGALGRCPEAFPWLEGAVPALESRMPAHAWRLAWARLELASCRTSLGQAAPLGESWPDVRRSLETARGTEDVLSQRALELEESLGDLERSTDTARPDREPASGLGDKQKKAHGDVIARGLGSKGSS